MYLPVFSFLSLSLLCVSTGVHQRASNITVFIGNPASSWFDGKLGKPGQDATKNDTRHIVCRDLYFLFPVCLVFVPGNETRSNKCHLSKQEKKAASIHQQQLARVVKVVSFLCLTAPMKVQYTVWFRYNSALKILFVFTILLQSPLTTSCM